VACFQGKKAMDRTALRTLSKSELWSVRGREWGEVVTLS